MIKLPQQPNKDQILYVRLYQTLTDLFENLRSHVVTAVEDDSELPTSLHLFKKGSRVLRVQRKLPDL